MENNFKKLSNSALVLQLKGLASRERKLTSEILRYLGEVQSRRLFLELGYSSLFSFCVRHLGFTEGETQRRISAMRVMREIPEIEHKVERGSLSLSAVAQVASFCSREEKNLEEKKELLEQVSGKTTRECEKILLSASQKAETAPVNKAKQITHKQTRLTVTITPEVLEQLKKLKNLLGHKNPQMSYGDLVAELAGMALKKLDPAQKGAHDARAVIAGPRAAGAGIKTAIVAAVSLGKGQGGNEKVEGGRGVEVRSEAGFTQQRESHLAQKVFFAKSDGEDARRKPIPAHVKRNVWLRDEGKCRFISREGVKCESTFMLEIDHEKPVSLGGTNVQENLRLLCRNHNIHMAVQVLGKEVMRPFVLTK